MKIITETLSYIENVRISFLSNFLYIAVDISSAEYC